MWEEVGPGDRIYFYILSMRVSFSDQLDRPIFVFFTCIALADTRSPINFINSLIHSFFKLRL